MPTAEQSPRNIRPVPQLSLHTPVGDITVSEEDGVVVSLDWGWGRDQTKTPLLAQVRDQLHDYFDGAAVVFDVPLAPTGTPYQKLVWAELCRIPRGATRTYREIAAAAGGGARSVGQANGRNPIPILIPCHRVVATGGIGGYSGAGGLETKRALLTLERAFFVPDTGVTADLFMATHPPTTGKIRQI